VRSRRSRSYGFVPTIPFMVFILPYVMGRVLIRPEAVGRERIANHSSRWAISGNNHHPTIRKACGTYGRQSEHARAASDHAGLILAEEKRR
jgi:hypothetical protein